MKVGDEVFVRDNWIQDQNYRIPVAKVLEVKSCPVLLTKKYLLEFRNGVREWFDSVALKTQ